MKHSYHLKIRAMVYRQVNDRLQIQFVEKFIPAENIRNLFPNLDWIKEKYVGKT